MKISYNWLNDYLDIDRTPHELAELLTMVGLEVESVERLGSVPDRTVVGQVLNVERHPDADRLTVCSVDVGVDSPLQIVCGAPNVEKGQKVPVALVGAVLAMPDKDRPGEVRELRIGKSKIRGIASQGMICAEDELGISEDHTGIMVLSPDAPVGADLGKHLAQSGRLLADHVLDVAVTPNRPDAVSHVGVARDVAALTGTELALPDVDIPTGDAAANQINIRIDSPHLCRRYVGLIVRDVAVSESPDWIKQRLEAVGLRPRNNVVDITNLVMYEIGQPLHAFDLDEIGGSEIIVRETKAPTSFVTLDEKERALPVGTLMICDGEREVAIAGVMGGQNSEVSEVTRNVLIESAYFDPTSIRKTAKALGLQSDASYRFERGVDPEGQVWAAARAAQLMAEVAGGTIVDGVVDVHPTPHERPVVRVRTHRVHHLLGTEIPEAEAIRLLQGIGFAVTAEERGVLSCVVPPYRPDVGREVDVIEEVARLYGYDRIEEPPRSEIPSFSPRDRKEDVARHLANSLLLGWGLREAYTNSLIATPRAERYYDEAVAGDLYGGTVVTTANAINLEMSTLRPSLLPGLLDVAKHNLNHGQTDIRLFEFGHVFSRQTAADSFIPGYEEHESLTLIQTGSQGGRHWSKPVRDFDVFDVKGVVSELLSAMGIVGAIERTRTEATAVAEWGVSYHAGGRYLGFAGRLSSDAAAAEDLSAPVFFAELNWTRLLSLSSLGRSVVFSDVSRYPLVERDLAFLLDRTQSVGPVLEFIRDHTGALLQEVTVFDVYEGDRVRKGKKSVAFGLVFGTDRTLTDSEVDREIEKIIEGAGKKFGAELRD